MMSRVCVSRDWWKELADDKAVLLSNPHHGLCLSKLAVLHFMQDERRENPNASSSKSLE